MERLQIPGFPSLDDISSWFQGQEPANRLDVMMALLEMLHPLELRFIGSCVEDFTRKDYDCFRDCEMRYNADNFVNDYMDLTNPFCRSKLLVALSLLRSTNYSVANVLYRILLTLDAVFERLPRTKEVLDEVLLLLNMGKHHPAFRFDQRIVIGQLADKISFLARNFAYNGFVQFYFDPSVAPPSNYFVQQSTNCHINCGSIDDHFNCGSIEPNVNYGNVTPVAATTIRPRQIDAITQTSFEAVAAKVKKHFIEGSSQTDAGEWRLKVEMKDHALQVAQDEIPVSNANEATQYASFLLPKGPLCVFIENIDLSGAKKIDNGEHIYELRTLWSDGGRFMVQRSLDDFYYLHQQFLQSFPQEAGLYNYARSLPYFPCYYGDSMEECEENLLVEMQVYIQRLNQMPAVISSDVLASFLASSPFPFYDGVSTDSDALGSFLPFELSSNAEGAEAKSRDTCTLRGDNFASNVPQKSQYSSTTVDIHNGLDHDASVSDTAQLPSTSATAVEPRLKKVLPSPLTKEIDRSFLASGLKLGDRDGLQSGLATTLIIVRPKPASTSFGKIIQSHMLSRDNPKTLCTGSVLTRKELPKTSSNDAF